MTSRRIILNNPGFPLNVAVAGGLPLPSGAATEATLATRASEATLSTRASEATLATRASEATLATRSSEATLSTRLSESAFLARLPAQGQALMAASVPVTLASNQPFLPVKDFFTEVTLGHIAGWSRMIFKGFNPAASAGNYIWTGGSSFTWRTTPTAAEILSSSANDTAAGTGAQTVSVLGVGTSYAATSEVVTLNGTGVVALANQYIHINKLIVATAGSGQTNAGNITARVSGGGATMQHMATGTSASQNSMFMTAANQAYLSLNQVLGGNGKVDVITAFGQEFFSSAGVLTRDNVFHINPGGNSPFVLPQDIPLIVPEKTGFGWRASAIDSGTPALTARVQGMFVNLLTSY